MLSQRLDCTFLHKSMNRALEHQIEVENEALRRTELQVLWYFCPHGIVAH